MRPHLFTLRLLATPALASLPACTHTRTPKVGPSTGQSSGARHDEVDIWLGREEEGQKSILQTQPGARASLESIDRSQRNLEVKIMRRESRWKPDNLKQANVALTHRLEQASSDIIRIDREV